MADTPQMMDFNFDLLSRFFHSLKMCSGVSLEKCDLKDLELNKMITLLRISACAVLSVMENSNDFK